MEVRNRAAAEKLRVLDVEPLRHVRGGYLVLADADASQRFAESGLYAEKLAFNMSREGLAIDMRRDDVNVRKYPLVYVDDGLRILRADLAMLSRTGQQLDLAPLLTRKIEIEYKEPRAFNWNSLSRGVDLDSLIGLVEKDSLISYTERLQAFFRRVSGTDFNYASADWIMSKFQDFGYDSVYLDTFTVEIYGEPKLC